LEDFDLRLRSGDLDFSLRLDIFYDSKLISSSVSVGAVEECGETLLHPVVRLE
jgi:hypothetical protein